MFFSRAIALTFAAFNVYILSHNVFQPDQEYTLIILKPDALELQVESSIYSKLEQEAGVSIDREVRFERAPDEKLSAHYEGHIGKSFFVGLIDYMISGPIIVSVWVGPIGSIKRVRDVIGSTDPKAALPGTVRALYGTSVQRNVIHGSDSAESASREIGVWFR